MLKIVFTGGGTGGHIFPIIAIVREMRKIKPKTSDLAIYYFGPKDDYVVESLGQEGGITLKQNFVDIFKIPLGFFQTLWHFFWLGPDLVFSKGGYGSFPAVLGAKLLGIPVFLHESDSIPGLASRIESKMATEVFTSFAKTKMLSKDKIINVGNPVREEIMNGSKTEAKKIFKIQSERPIILILGGSQGAVVINNLVIDILPEL
ncbi:MAG: glycosyltransferase, partial [Candidatus Gribaldobacteria bacterium]|nr:glycosyltransferase [Candidatus Gribaldobacteria bacterium]